MEIETIFRLTCGISTHYEVYILNPTDDLNITDSKFTSGIDFVNEYDNIVVCNAPSKAFNLAGLSTSYIMIPRVDLRNEFIKQTEREFLSKPTVFGYTALIKAYEEGELWLEEQNKHIKNNYLFLKDYLHKELPNLVVTKLEGTYLVWLDLSYTKLTTEELMDKCNNAGITCNGGVSFCKDYESFIRFNIACPFFQLEEGLIRLVKAFK